MNDIFETLNFLALPLYFRKLFLCLSLLGLIFLCYDVLKNIIRRSKYNAHLPGLKISWYNVLGTLWQVPFRKRLRNGYPLQSIVRQLIAGHSKLFQKKEIFHAWIFYHPIVFVNKAEAVESVLKDTAMLERCYTYIIPIFGDGLITSLVSKWKARRKLLNPCLHWDILLEYMSVFNAQASILVRNLLKETDDQIKELLEPISMCVVDITCETILGTKIGAQDSKNKEYVNALRRTSKIAMERALSWHLWPDFIFRLSRSGKVFHQSLKIVKDYTDSVLQQKKKEYLSGESQKCGRKRKSLMDLLLEHHMEKQTICEEDIKEEIDTFFAAANDTTALTVTSVLYFLGQDKDIQTNVHHELDRIFEGDKEKPTEKEDLTNMKYMECVIKEALRLFPSVALFGRTVPVGKTVCGYNLPEGATCFIVPYILHRDPEAFPDPEKFDPTRFFPENSCKRHPFAYIPFSAGPRDCIGKTLAMTEMKVILSALLRNFKVESLDPRDKLEHSLEIALRPNIALRFRLRRRI